MKVKENKQTVWKISDDNCLLNEITVEEHVEHSGSRACSDHYFWEVIFTSSPNGREISVAQYDSEADARAFVENFLKLFSKENRNAK